MKVSENLGTLFLGCWLVLGGFLSLLRVHVSVLDTLLPLFALAAGVLILLGSAKLTKSLGFLLLGIWLIARGVSPLLNVNIPYLSGVLDLLGLAAGLLILLKR
ncbi:MAG: hypothetical protein ABIL68_08190 [bacterium]